jgi:hypothetical protein
VIRISTHHWMWEGKRSETSFWTCAPLSKTIAMTISQSVSWPTVHSLLQRHQSKWVPWTLMVWPNWHRERWEIEKCEKPKRVHSVVRKWIGEKRNVGLVGQVNNQALALGPTHERNCAYMIFEGTFIKNEAIFCSCRQSTKKAYN